MGKTGSKWKAAKKLHKTAKAASQKAETEAAALAGPWVGKAVICIAASASRFWQNSHCTVVRQVPTTQQLTLQLSTGTKRQADIWEVAEQKPAAKAAMSEKLDFRNLTKL